MISIKSPKQIKKMIDAGKVVGDTHQMISETIEAGMSTWDLDQIVDEYICRQNAVPAFKGYSGFPNAACISINEEVVHGIPSKSRIIRNGDIVSVDIGAIVDGYYGDSAKTFGIGTISDTARKLIDVTRQSFYEGIKFAKTGYRLSDISNAVQTYVESNGFSVVRDYVGHGIGKNLHEDPPIPNFGAPGKGPRLTPGMALAIEPMVNVGTWQVRVLSDDWTVVTADSKLSAHYEHTIMITDNDKPMILTASNSGELYYD
jgi:methionyl aminopeptidase